MKKSSTVLVAVAVSGLLASEAFAQPAAVRVDAGMDLPAGLAVATGISIDARLCQWRRSRD